MTVFATVFETVFTILFASESLLKIFGLTTDKFMKDNFNTFDLVIVLASILELMFSSSNKGIISGFRAFRLARLFKLARSNHTLKCLLDSITGSLGSLGRLLEPFWPAQLDG